MLEHTQRGFFREFTLSHQGLCFLGYRNEFCLEIRAISHLWPALLWSLHSHVYAIHFWHHPLVSVAKLLKEKNIKYNIFWRNVYSNPLTIFFFFLMWTIFKIFVEYCFCFMFWVIFWPPGMWDLSPQSGIEPAPMHWKCRVLIAGPPGKSPFNHFYKESFLLFFPAAVEL